MNLREEDIRKKIDAYVKGQLEEAEIQELWEAFARKPELLDELEIEIGVKKLIEQEALASKPERGANITSLPGWTWHAAAAAVIIIVAAIQLLKVEPKTEMEQFVVQHITPDQVETADGIRAKDMSISSADSLLNLGFEAVASGDQERALELYNEVIGMYPGEPYLSKAYFNKGVVLYNEGNYEEAIPAFREAANRAEAKMISEKAYWYLGNALTNAGKLEEARKAVYEAYAMDGVFRSAAFKLLQKLNYDLGNSGADEAESTQTE